MTGVERPLVFMDGESKELMDETLLLLFLTHIQDIQTEQQVQQKRSPKNIQDQTLPPYP